MKQIYTAKELTEILQNEGDKDITLRTVRHYAEIGILPDRVIIQGRKRFTQEHLDYLRALRTLQKTGESLDGIKVTLNSLPPEDIQSIGTQMNYYSTQTLISTQAHHFNPDVSFTFNNHVAPEVKNEIISCVSNILSSHSKHPSIHHKKEKNT